VYRLSRYFVSIIDQMDIVIENSGTLLDGPNFADILKTVAIKVDQMALAF